MCVLTLVLVCRRSPGQAWLATAHLDLQLRTLQALEQLSDTLGTVQELIAEEHQISRQMETTCRFDALLHFDWQMEKASQRA